MKKDMKKIVVLFLITLLTLTFVHANVSVSSSVDGIVVDYTSPVIGYTDVEANGEVYVKITADGIGTYLEENRAELPVARVSLVVDNANVAPEIEVLSVETETISLDKRVYPVQAYSTDGQPVPFAIDEAYYASQGYGAALAEVSDPYKIREIAGVDLAINAVQYNPAAGTVTVVKSAKVLVKANAYTRSVVDSKAFHQIYSKTFANYDGYYTRQKEILLIVAADQYMNNSQLQEFVTYKQAMYDVKLVSKSEAGTVKSYVKAQYDNPSTRPTYLMLLGRATDFPYETVSGNKSYIRYTTMDSDMRPDIVLGLLFGRTETAINNALRKAINTEKNVGSMTNKIIHYSSFKNDSHINDEFKEIQDYWEQENEFEIVNVLAYIFNKTDKDAMAALNNGARFFTYQGHGFQTGWENFNALSLADNSIHPFALSFACLTGDFSYSSAVWAERWIGHEKLSTTFLGASENSSYEQKSMNRGMARGATEEDIDQIGPLVVYGKNYVYGDNGSSQGDQGQTKYHLFGDPTCYILPYTTPDPTPTATPTSTIPPTPVYDDYAINRPVVVSGEYSAQYPKEALVDGNDSTVWGSSYNAGDQWFYVDLGQEVDVDHVIVKFYNPYYSPKYYIGVSNNAVDWDLPASVSNGNGGDDKVQLNARGRYVGVLLTAGAMNVYGVKTFCAMVERMPTPTPVITPVPTPDNNIIKNGNFANGMTNWDSYIDPAASASVAVENGVCKLSISNGGSANWHVQLAQMPVSYQNGTTYTVKFDARGASARAMTVIAGMSQDPYIPYGEKTVNLTTNMQTYTFSFTMTGSTDSNAVLEFDCGSASGDVYIDNVSVTR